MKKSLIVYYSYSGNTQEVARQIWFATGGDLHELIPVSAYPSDFNECVEQAKWEIENGYKPEIAGKRIDPNAYNRVFVGTPNWWNTMAPPVATFLSQCDLSGKTVVPFCTHGGGGKGTIFTDIAKMSPEGGHLDGFSWYGNKNLSSQEDVWHWLHAIRVLEN